ncbi:unnamed protein product [Paramecium sonneborni]|uniref:Uncharacterized protein n=1 Tax=Paramecium sonneborni TaxID=65129 RepID=A0A8S1RCC9_9CILI|nr:unnamed protein product [Paramecium sonneborni]
MLFSFLQNNNINLIGQFVQKIKNKNNNNFNMNNPNQILNGYPFDTPFRIQDNKVGVVEIILYSIGKNPIVQRRAKDENRMFIEGAFINRNIYQY